MSENISCEKCSQQVIDKVVQMEKDMEAIYEILHSEAYHKRTQYLDMLIERENKRAELRKAIIEKTLASLIWSGIVALGYAIWHTFFTTGGK